MTRLQLEVQQEREWQGFEREHIGELTSAAKRAAYELGVRHGRELVEFRAKQAEEWEAQWK